MPSQEDRMTETLELAVATLDRLRPDQQDEIALRVLEEVATLEREAEPELRVWALADRRINTRQYGHAADHAQRRFA
jgi:hypothetical protein